MARIKMGAIVTDIKGKLGGHSFQKGNQSRVLKTNRTPRNVTSFAKNQRQVMINASIQAWSSFTFEQKVLWDNASSIHSRLNAFGDSVIYSGRQLFLYLQNNQRKAGFTPTTSSIGLVTGFGSAVQSTFSIDLGTGVLARTGSGTVGTDRLAYYIYIGKKGSTVFNVRKFKFLLSSGSTDGSSTDAYDIFRAKFGAVYVGQNVWAGMQKVNPSGFASSLQIVKVTIT